MSKDNKDNNDLGFIDAAAPTHMSIMPKLFSYLYILWLGIIFVSLFVFILFANYQYTFLIKTIPNTEYFFLGLTLNSKFFIILIMISEYIFALGFMFAGVNIYNRSGKEINSFLTSVSFITFASTLIFSLANTQDTVPDFFVFWLNLIRAIGWSSFLAVLYTFPNGKFLSRWTKRIFWMWFGLATYWSIYTAVSSNPNVRALTYQNKILLLIFTLWFGTGLLFLFIRYVKFASTTQQQQIRWGVYGWSLPFIAVIILWATPIITGFITSPSKDPLVFQAISAFFLASISLLTPYLRLHSMNENSLSDIDFWISNTTIYGITVLSTGGIFLITLLLLQSILAALPEQTRLIIAYSGATMVGTSLFNPIAKKLESFVDKRYGINIKYRHTTHAPSRSSFMKIGQYTIERLIGTGGMAEVFLARDTTSGHPVAIKILSQEISRLESFHKRLNREAKALASLDHPNIVSFIDHGDIDGRCYIIMDYVPGKNLYERMLNSEPMDIDLALNLITEIAKALDFAHGKGFVHRDIKPSNVIIEAISSNTGTDMQYKPVLTDFGIVKMIVTDQTDITKTGIVGSFDYIAPEQIRPSVPIDGRADIYSLGVMTYQMLTGKLPFQSSNPGKLIMAHLKQIPENPRSFREEISNEMADAILIAMQKSPDKRFNTALDFARALSK